MHVWHVFKQPHSAKHTPSPTAASRASRHGQQNSSTATGALYIGAFIGMPRSAAYKGVVATVKANRPADPTAIMRRNMAHTPALLINNIRLLTHREAGFQQFTAHLRAMWHLGNKVS